MSNVSEKSDPLLAGTQTSNYVLPSHRIIQNNRNVREFSLRSRNRSNYRSNSRRSGGGNRRGRGRHNNRSNQNISSYYSQMNNMSGERNMFRNGSRHLNNESQRGCSSIRQRPLSKFKHAVTARNQLSRPFVPIKFQYASNSCSQRPINYQYSNFQYPQTNNSRGQNSSDLVDSKLLQWDRNANRPWAVRAAYDTRDDEIHNTDEELEHEVSETPPWLINKKQKIESNSTFEVREEVSAMNSVEEEEDDNVLLSTTIVEVPSFEITLTDEKKVKFKCYNDLGFEEDAEGRIICYIHSRSLPVYTGGIITGIGVFFSPLHPCNLSLVAKMSMADDDGGIEAAANAISIISKYGCDKIAICSSSRDLFKSLLLKNQTQSSEKTATSLFYDNVKKISLASFVPLDIDYNEVYLSEAVYLSSVAAGLSPSPPPSLICCHSCTDEELEEGDVVSIRSEDIEVNENGKICEGLFKIAVIMEAVLPHQLYMLKSLMLDCAQQGQVVTKDELHLVKKAEKIKVEEQYL